MPVYIATLSGCECTPVPDMVFRADDMVSAVMQCQEKLEVMRCKALEAKVDTCCDLSIESIEIADFELMDEVGIESVVGFWKDVVKK